MRISGEASSPVAVTDLTSENWSPIRWRMKLLSLGDSSVRMTARCSLVRSTDLPGSEKRFWVWSLMRIHATEEYRLGSWLPAA